MTISTTLTTSKNNLTNALYDYMFAKISNMELEDSFLVSSFYKETEIATGSDEDKVFHSSYNQEILSTVSRRLYFKGLWCNISFKGNLQLTSRNFSLGKRIEYTTRVVNFKKYLALFTMMLLPFTWSAMSTGMGMDMGMDIGGMMGMFSENSGMNEHSDHRDHQHHDNSEFSDNWINMFVMDQNKEHNTEEFM
jgi:hypothetical protein